MELLQMQSNIKDKKLNYSTLLHDEGYAYMNLVRKNFLDSKRIL